MKQGRCGVGRLTVRIFKVMQIDVINVYPLTGEVQVTCKLLKRDVYISAHDSRFNVILFK